MSETQNETSAQGGASSNEDRAMMVYQLRAIADEWEQNGIGNYDPTQNNFTLEFPLDHMRKNWEDLKKAKDAAFLRKLREDSEAPSRRLDFSGSSFVLEVDGKDFAGALCRIMTTKKGNPVQIAAQMPEQPQPQTLNLELLALVLKHVGDGASTSSVIEVYKKLVEEFGEPK